MVIPSIADVEDALIDLADFEELGSAARARAFITAANRWLALRAESASNQSSSVTLGKSYVEKMAARARVIASAGSGSVRHLGVARDYR